MHRVRWALEKCWQQTNAALSIAPQGHLGPHPKLGILQNLFSLFRLPISMEISLFHGILANILLKALLPDCMTSSLRPQAAAKRTDNN